jgi:RNA polymerase sigma factor (sigma-70 family)
MTDHKILDLLRTGDSDLAINALYHHYPMIRKLVRANRGTAKDAEDVFQETLLVLLNKAADPQFQLTAKLSTYLYSVARFIWNDQLKKQKPHVPYDEIPDQPDLADALADENRARLAETVITELQERCRELLVLFYLGKTSLKDIAAKMGYSSENTAKNQKYKCLETARTRLKQLTSNPATL